MEDFKTLSDDDLYKLFEDLLKEMNRRKETTEDIQE